MLVDYVDLHKPEKLITFTRNASILRMLGSVADTLYPLKHSQQDQALAELLGESVTTINEVAYELERYDTQGLFRGFDPADRPYELNNPETLKQRFEQLTSVQAALVVVATLPKGAAS